jgi:hypothetical protein
VEQIFDLPETGGDGRSTNQLIQRRHTHDPPDPVNVAIRHGRKTGMDDAQQALLQGFLW